MKKTILIYGLGAAFLLLLIQFSKYQLFVKYISFEVFVGLLAICFTVVGVFFGLKLTKPKVEERVLTGDDIDDGELSSFGLSNRELEILNQINLGKSNQEIADQLFISLSTVKSHVSKLYSKLDVKNRVQAIQKAKALSNKASTKV